MNTESKKITDPGIYAVTCTWAEEQKIGKNKTAAYRVLFKTSDERGIYATIWNSDKCRKGTYFNRICEAMQIPNCPPEIAEDFKGRQCNIVVNINDRGYPEVDAYQPYDLHKETTAGELEEPEPEHQTTQEYLDSIKPQDSGEDVPF